MALACKKLLAGLGLCTAAFVVGRLTVVPSGDEARRGSPPPREREAARSNDRPDTAAQSMRVSRAPVLAVRPSDAGPQPDPTTGAPLPAPGLGLALASTSTEYFDLGAVENQRPVEPLNLLMRRARTEPQAQERQRALAALWDEYRYLMRTRTDPNAAHGILRLLAEQYRVEEDEWVRRCLAAWLVLTGSPEIIDSILRAVREAPQLRERLAAVKALGEVATHGYEQSYPVLSPDGSGREDWRRSLKDMRASLQQALLWEADVAASSTAIEAIRAVSAALGATLNGTPGDRHGQR